MFLCFGFLHTMSHLDLGHIFNPTLCKYSILRMENKVQDKFVVDYIL